ncbi:MAG: GspH/FimT family pseudopilin, partial [Pseudomonadota bacterium]
MTTNMKKSRAVLFILGPSQYFKKRFKAQIIGEAMGAGKRESGFSLVELIIVMLIFAVMGAIAVPSFLGISSRGRLKSAARDIVSNMQLARIQALKRSATWAIQFDTGSARYRVLSDDGADDTWNTGDDTVYKTVNLSDYPGVSYGSAKGAIPGGAAPG